MAADFAGVFYPPGWSRSEEQEFLTMNLNIQRIRDKS